MIAAPVKLGTVMAQTTLKLRITQVKRTRFRLWLSLKIMQFAAFVCPCKVDISHD